MDGTSTQDKHQTQPPQKQQETQPQKQQEAVFSPSAIAADMQRRTRKQNNFDQIEADLPDPKKLAAASADAVASLTPGFTTRFSLAGALSRLGRFNPFGGRAVTSDDAVWLFDNTAYRTAGGRFSSTWEAEFVAAVFEQEPRSHLVDAVAGVARVLGIADDAEERKTIQERLIPFVWDVRVGKTVTVTQTRSSRTIKLGPTGFNGVSSNVAQVRSHSKGAMVEARAGDVPSGIPGLLGMNTYYASPSGWGIISGTQDEESLQLEDFFFFVADSFCRC